MLTARIQSFFLLVMFSPFLLAMSSTAFAQSAGDAPDAPANVAAPKKIMATDAAAYTQAEQSDSKPRKKLRFRDGPTCLCADGLREKDIRAGQREQLDGQHDKQHEQTKTGAPASSTP